MNRKLTAFGLPLLLAYAFIPILFYLLSDYLFSKTTYAAYVYAILALGIIAKTSEAKRNDFLKSIFSLGKYRTVRSLENFICSIPFVVFLVYKEQFLIALLLVIASILMAFFNFSPTTYLTLPTPFSKKPFEYPQGFRNTIFIFPIAYFLALMSIAEGNFNLGIFSMIVLALVCISYYSTPEKEYFVWNYNLSPKCFLVEKIKTSLTYFTLICLPIMIGLSIFFFDDIIPLMAVFLLCYVYLGTIVLAKYSAYPDEMNVPQGILIAVSLLFPPVLIGVIPFLYYQSIKKLHPLLDDSN